MTNRSDDFNRANTINAIGTPSDAGSDWIQLSGAWGIINTAQGYESGGASDCACVLDCGSNIVLIQVTLTVRGNSPGIVLRAADSNNYIVARFESGNLVLFTKIAGVSNVLDTDGSATANGDVITASVDASDNIVAKLNGTTVLTGNSSAGSANTKHGLWAHGSNDSRFDDFSITDNSGGGGGGTDTLMGAICL